MTPRVSFCKGNFPRRSIPARSLSLCPTKGVHFQVFYDRIPQSDPDLAPSLMALGIVHEITHILQGIDRHSAGGIMKAVWTSSDYTQMKRGVLRFTAVDVEMIHESFAARTARNVPGTLVAAVAP